MLGVDAGVQAPAGDPGRVAAAAGWHEGLAGFMDASAAQVEYSVGSLWGASWRGEAAAAYGELGLLVAAHFRQAGSVALSAARTLRRYAQELERLQREGVQAVAQTVHWLQELERDQVRLGDAQRELASAQAAVSGAQAALGRGAGGALPGAAVAHLGQDLSAAQARLTQAQSAVGLAQRAVAEDEREVQRCQQRARQIWQEAQNAAAMASGSLEPLAVAPPPLAGAPATFTDALAADAPFLASHRPLSQALAQQIAQGNAARHHLGSAAARTDQQRVLTALEDGQNLDGVPLSEPHHGGAGLLDALATGALVGLTEVVGGGPEDPAADGLSALEVDAIDGGADAAATAATAGSTASDDAGAVAERASGPALARQLGSEGEAAVPGSGNAVRIPSATGTAAYRIPDILDPEAGVIGEVKNVSSLSYTSQLRDFADYAQEHGYEFDLYTRTATRLSGPLQQAIREGQIDLRYLPGG